MRGIEGRLDRLERDAPGGFDFGAAVALLRASIRAGHMREAGEDVQFPHVPLADDPFWCAAPSGAAVAYRQVCLAIGIGES